MTAIWGDVLVDPDVGGRVFPEHLHIEPKGLAVRLAQADPVGVRRRGIVVLEATNEPAAHTRIPLGVQDRQMPGLVDIGRRDEANVVATGPQENEPAVFLDRPRGVFLGPPGLLDQLFVERETILSVKGTELPLTQGQPGLFTFLATNRQTGCDFERSNRRHSSPPQVWKRDANALPVSIQSQVQVAS